MASSQTPQNFKNHVKFHPPFHFVILPLVVALLILTFRQLFRDLNILTVTLVLLSITVFILAFLTRTYSLKVQDRLIRLEERLRMATLLPEDLRKRALELTVSQYVALRFASDSELAALVKRALDENLSSRQIKTSIANWRADYDRV